MVNDGIATTKEIDGAIRLGFGLRWASMGPFETYRIAGGIAGVLHFIEQFGPCLQWPWSKHTDVPELTEDLINEIALQSDAQPGHMTIRQLERRRDENLVGNLGALKVRDLGAEPLVTQDRTVPIDWTDYNGHINESRYGQVFSDAADYVMVRVGSDQEYIDAGSSILTVEIGIKFLMECHAGQRFSVQSKVIEASGKKVRPFHRMIALDGVDLATGDQLVLHVLLQTR